MTKNMYVINNKSNGVVRMYVTTSLTHKPEVRIDQLTFTQIVNNFARLKGTPNRTNCKTF